MSRNRVSKPQCQGKNATKAATSVFQTHFIIFDVTETGRGTSSIKEDVHAQKRIASTPAKWKGVTGNKKPERRGAYNVLVCLINNLQEYSILRSIT